MLKIIISKLNNIKENGILAWFYTNTQHNLKTSFSLFLSRKKINKMYIKFITMHDFISKKILVLA